MFLLLSSNFAFARDRRAAIRQTAPVAALPVPRSNTRSRKGVRGAAKTIWRRSTTGSNHISAFGVWRDRSRRVVSRVNRTGETRWHRLPVAGGYAGRRVLP